MPIRAVCPNGHALRVKDKLAGKEGVCPTCEAAFVVPTAAEGPPLPDGLPADTSLPTVAVEWRVTLPDGQQFGPTVPLVFGQWIAAGRVTADSLVWRTGWAEWKTAGEAAADLPTPLSNDAPETAAAELPAGVTLPPSPPVSEPVPPDPPTAPAGVYGLRKKRQARRRRNLALLLAVACLTLIAMLVWLVVSGPPAGAPDLPPR